jgi:hypothetical protein
MGYGLKVTWASRLVPFSSCGETCGKRDSIEVLSSPLHIVVRHKGTLFVGSDSLNSVILVVKMRKSLDKLSICRIMWLKVELSGVT